MLLRAYTLCGWVWVPCASKIQGDKHSEALHRCFVIYAQPWSLSSATNLLVVSLKEHVKKSQQIGMTTSVQGPGCGALFCTYDTQLRLLTATNWAILTSVELTKNYLINLQLLKVHPQVGQYIRPGLTTLTDRLYPSFLIQGEQLRSIYV